MSSTDVNAEKQPLTLEVFPTENSEFYYAKLNMPKQLYNSSATKIDHVQTIVILDQSGSMGDSVGYILEKVLPKLFATLGYMYNAPIDLIIFESTSRYYKTTASSIARLGLRCLGGTNFAPAIRDLKNLILSQENDRIRIITLSDGDICDKDDCKIAADELALVLSERNMLINSIALRYNSSDYANPDTEALCSLLRLNNVGTSSMLEIARMNNLEKQVDTLFQVLSNDGLDFSCKLTSSSEFFKAQPWQERASSQLQLISGFNEMWIDARQLKVIDKLFVGSHPVEIVTREKLSTAESAAKLMKSAINRHTAHLKVLRVANSEQSLEEMQRILEFYKNLEAQLTEEHLEAPADNLLKSRLNYLKNTLEIRSRAFYTKMAQIANDDTIGQLNAAQKAEYLRTTNVSKTSRGLARRAVKSGLDFDSVAREEAKAIVDNLHLLDQLPECEHVSFYSLETTIGGFKGLKDLIQADEDDILTAADILQVINIVGMAARGPVGDYPDPMTYRLDCIYPNCFVSISDLITARLQGGELTVPGFPDDVITTVIPVFEDHRLAQFMRKHAPTIMSYYCSIGMRGMIADVPMTDGYTICAGLWKLVEDIAKQPTELKLRTFGFLCESYELFVGSYFDCVDKYLQPAESNADLKTSMFLNNFGTTNMIAPLYKHLKNSPSATKAMMPRILRALFNYEVWQTMRRLFKGSERAPDVISSKLTSLLGIDLDKCATTPQPVFTEEPKQLVFHSEYYADYSYVQNELVEKLAWYVKYVALLPLLLESVANGTITSFKVPTIDNQFLASQLDIEDMDEYWFLLVSQAFMYPASSDRSDRDAEKMLIHDLKYPDEFKLKLKEYCAKAYKSHYDTLLSAKRKAELAECKNLLLDRIFASKTIEEAAEHLKNGVRIGYMDFRIATSFSYGYNDFKERLLNSGKCPILAQLIKLFILTRVDFDSEPVYNGGKVSWVREIDELERVFLNSGGSKSEWDRIKEFYVENAMHRYRANGKPNRHTHHDGKPSYWARGFQTLEDFRNSVSPDAFEEYCQVHFDCCGVNQLISSRGETN